MKVGIVTFTDGTNYGQRLQNLAVQEILKSHGYDVCTFKIRRPDYGLFSFLKRNIKSMAQFSEFIAERKRKKSFERFNREYIRFYEHEIFSGMNSEKIQKKFDLVVAGSDQVWNPYSAWVTDVNFLQFIEPDKRMAFAASFSVDEIPDDRKHEYRRYLCGISRIAVREFQGAEIIRYLCDREVPVVLDPTLLLPKLFWQSIARKPRKELPTKYVVSYFLGETVYRQEIEKWAKVNKREIINFDVNSAWHNLAPDEFIYVIQHAELVLTDSYHGTIFSILFHVEFRNFPRKGQEFSMSSRFETLYKLLGIKSKEVVSMDFNQKKFDFKEIDLKIMESKVYSIEVLDDFIKEIEMMKEKK